MFFFSVVSTIIVVFVCVATIVARLIENNSSAEQYKGCHKLPKIIAFKNILHKIVRDKHIYKRNGVLRNGQGS